jgi:dipeptidyl aminopeptidase/acylaminoacyl peptidase
MAKRLPWLSLVFLAAFGCGREDTPPPVAPAPMAPAPVVTAALMPPPPTAAAPKAPVELAEYFKIRRVGGRVSVSADEKLVAFLSDEGGRPDIWVRPIAGGAAAQVTHSEGFVHSLAFSPKDDLLAFEADKGGDELPHLYLTSSKGEAPRDLVPDLPAGRRTQFVGWADDGKTLLFLSSQSDEKALDLYEYDVRKGKTTLLWKSEGRFELAGVSRDHARFVVAETHSDADNDLYLVDRASPEKPRAGKPPWRVLLTKHTGSILYSPQFFSRDDRTLHFTSDGEGEFNSLYAMEVATQKIKPVQKGDWDIDAADQSFTGRYILSTANADGSPQLVVTDTATGKPVALPAAPPGGAWDAVDSTRTGAAVLGFSRSDRYLSVVLRSDASPVIPYVLDLKEGRAIALADPLPESLKGRPMTTGIAVRVPSFDGQKVPAFLYSPAGPGPFPAVIDVHGGPTAQSHRDFSRIRQYLVSKGYVVLVPNVRGSTGYGKTWTRLDNLDLGGGPLKDIVACKKYLVEQAHVAADKVVVMGGSYGGYMALAAATFTPNEFAANVDYFGVSDLKSLVESFPPYWAAQSSYIFKKFGDPKNPADATYQHDRSPLYFADRITRPLLVVQGERDPRVKADQSERIVAALRQRHVPVHYLLLAGEGHGFTKNENYLRTYELTDRFLDRYIWGDTSVKVD